MRHINKYNLKFRNLIRSFSSLKTEDAIKLLNKIRKTKTISHIYTIEKLLRENEDFLTYSLPAYFPQKPQTDEYYERLLELNKEHVLEYIETAITENFEKLLSAFSDISKLNRAILEKNIDSADAITQSIYKNYGYSHLLLRKSLLVKSINKKLHLKNIDQFISDCNSNKRNLITSAIEHSYKEEQDYISIKKSILNIRDNGNINQYTRDITSFIFKPNVDNLKFHSTLNSWLQSSLIDTIIFLKVNNAFIEDKYSFINKIIKHFSLEEELFKKIKNFYTHLDPLNSESLFYKHSSAWLECGYMLVYKKYIDDFFEKNINKEELNKYELEAQEITTETLNINLLGDLDEYLIKENITRSASFNLLIHQTLGYINIKEELFVKILETTTSLDKICAPEHLTAMKISAGSDLTQLSLLLLIHEIKKDTESSFELRMKLEEMYENESLNNGFDLINVIESQSKTIAEYAYFVFTEEFLTFLFEIFDKTSDITKCRADMHRWMGDNTKDPSYYDKARTLIISQQLIRIRDEINDNRIYVDTTRLTANIIDEYSNDINSIITSVKYSRDNNNPVQIEILGNIFEKIYNSFCSNPIFGISAYLGRRIRHGTFKGTLYETPFSHFKKLTDTTNHLELKILIEKWRALYELSIDNFIGTYLHIENADKPDGIFKTSFKESKRNDLRNTAIKHILDDKNIIEGNLETTIEIVIEYCWRILEIDLAEISKKIRTLSKDFYDTKLLDEIKKKHNTQIVNNSISNFDINFRDNLNQTINWFKRPPNVSPKAPVNLLVQAVIEEVKEFNKIKYENLEQRFKVKDAHDYEIIGSSFLLLYDALYVMFFNALKHGSEKEDIFLHIDNFHNKKIDFEVISSIKLNDDESEINKKLACDLQKIETANLFENRSGMVKIYHMAKYNNNFKINHAFCEHGKVKVSVSLLIENLI